MARVGGFLPSLQALYDDEALLEAAPVVRLADTALAHARPRPTSPIYSLLSPRLALMFENVLSGDVPADAAVAQTARELRNIVRRYGY
jgi:multiple sugar transport system substrate-binding protein